MKAFYLLLSLLPLALANPADQRHRPHSTKSCTTPTPAATPTPCGSRGLAPCPSSQICIDNPASSCGQATDCPGICITPISCGGFPGTPCPSGQRCIDDPRDTCDPANGGADCIGICVASRSSCGGLTGIQCPTNQVCVDDLAAGCGLAADCLGVCVVPVFCGGFGGIACAGGGTCVDDPRDSCDPANGGADCGGICV